MDIKEVRNKLDKALSTHYEGIKVSLDQSGKSIHIKAASNPVAAKGSARAFEVRGLLEYYLKETRCKILSGKNGERFFVVVKDRPAETLATDAKPGCR